AKKIKGITCNSVNYKEMDLYEIVANILEIDKFDEEIFKNEIEKIIVLDDGALEFNFYGGRKVKWQKQ
ncbi:MAG: recombinase family protein, partial [Clostridiales bacterium]